MRKIVYKRFATDISAANATYSKKFDLDKNIKRVLGLQLTSERPDLLFYRGSQRLEINGDELYPEGYDSRLLQNGLDVPIDVRFADLGDGVLSGNGEVKISYRDADATLAAFAAYSVALILKCEIE